MISCPCRPHNLTSFAIVLLLGFGFAGTASAQGRPQDTTRAGAPVKDAPLTPAERQGYVAKYTTDLPGGHEVALRVFEENGARRLWVSNPDQSRRRLYQGSQVFQLENAPDFILTFVMLNDTAMKFTVHKPEGDLVAFRIN